MVNFGMILKMYMFIVMFISDRVRNSCGIDSLVMLRKRIEISVVVIMNRVLRMLLVVIIWVCLFLLVCVWIRVYSGMM